MRTLSVSLIEHKKIKTTEAKAKELRPFAEKLLTQAKKVKDAKTKLATVRILKKDLPVVAITELLKIAEKMDERKGGYLRIVKTSPRKSDTAKMAFVEWVDRVIDKKEGKKGEEIKKSDASEEKEEEKKETERAEEDKETEDKK